MDKDRVERLVAVAREHAAAEARGDMEGTLATLEDVPVYEMQPARLRLSGIDAARRCYDHFFSEFLPLAGDSLLKAEWVTEEGLGQEYGVQLRMPDGSAEWHNVIGVLLFGADRLAGERIYASERLFRLMYGPGFDAAVPFSQP